MLQLMSLPSYSEHSTQDGRRGGAKHLSHELSLVSLLATVAAHRHLPAQRFNLPSRPKT